MTDDEPRRTFPVRRRTVLKAAGAGLAGIGTIPQAVEGTASGTELWRFQPYSSGSLIDAPTVVGGTVYTSVAYGELSALDAATGSLRWEFSPEGDSTDVGGATPSVVDGTVYYTPGTIPGAPATSGASTVFALDAADGTVRWATEGIATLADTVTVADGSVYVGADATGISTNDTMYALDAEDGSIRWETAIESELSNGLTAPTVVDGTVFVCQDRNVYALDAADGSIRWEFQAEELGEDFENAAPTVADGTVYAAANLIQASGASETVYALGAADGSQEWRYERELEDAQVVTLKPSPTVADGTLLTGSGDGAVYALDTADGSVQWEFDTGGRVSSSPTVADGVVFVGGRGEDGSVYALDAADGSSRWEFQAEETFGFLSAPTVVDGIVFIGSGTATIRDAGTLWAIYAGVGGSSEDSRVELGTLGHHHSWAGEPPQDILTEVTGTVTAADTGDPIPDVDVYMATSDQAHAGLALLDAYPEAADPAEELELATSDTTDGDGEFALAAVDPGHHFILAFPPTDTDYAPTLVSDVVLAAGENRTESITLSENPLSCLDPVIDQLLAGSEDRLGAATEAAGEVFLDGADRLGDEVIDTLDVVDYAVDVDLDAAPEQFRGEVRQELAETGLDFAEHGLDLVLAQLWDAFDEALQAELSDSSGVLADQAWLRELAYDDLDTLVEEGYTATPLYGDATDSIEAAGDTYESIRPPEVSEGFSIDAAKTVLRGVIRQLRTPGHGVPGVVVTPGGDTYRVDQAETYERNYDWTADRLDDIDDAQTLAQVTQVIGGALMVTGVGTVVGAKLFAAGKKSQAALEKAEMVAATKLALDWVLTQLHWALDLGEIPGVAPATVAWLDDAFEDGLADASLEIESVEMDLIDLPELPPYVFANRPASTPPWFPVTVQWEAVREATVAVRNTGEEPADVRVTMHDRFGGGENVARRGSTAPSADAEPLTVPPGATRTVSMEYAAEFDLNPLTDHTMAIQLWSDGALRATRAVPFQVRLGATAGAAGTAAGELRTPALGITRGDTDPDESLTPADLDEVRPTVETVLDETVAPGDAVAETTHEVDADTRRLEYTLATAGEVALQITDGDGNVVGYEPGTDEVRTDLPGASYAGPEETPQTVRFEAEPGATYTVRAVGYRFLQDVSASVTVHARATPERDAILSVSPTETGAFLAPGGGDDVELTVSEIGGQTAIADVTVDSGTFTDGAGNELSDVTIVPEEEAFDIEPDADVRLPVSFDVEGDVTPPGASDDTRFEGDLTVETGNAGSLSVSVSALVLATNVEGARLVGGSKTVGGVALTAVDTDAVSDPPDGTEPVAAYDLDVTGDGVVQLGLPAPSPRSAVYAPGENWATLDTGRVDGQLRLTVAADGVERVVVASRGPPAIVGGDPPQDPDGDGLYEDIDGDGELTVGDVQLFFENRDSEVVQTNAEFFNFSGTDPDEVTVADVQALFQLFTGE